DDISGVKSNLVVFESPSRNSERSFALRENKNTGYWEYNYTVGEYDEVGDWQLRSFLVRDNANNYKIYSSNEIEGNLDFRVNNTNGDNIAPEIKGLEISPKEANTGDTIKIKAKITDDISGVKSNLVVFESPSGNSERSFALKENKDTGYWEYNYTVGEHDEAGDWQLRSFLVRDNANNYKIYYSNEIEGSLDFRVNNTSGDNTPPEIKSVEISPKEANAGETIKIKTKITDDISGVKSNLVVFESPSRNSERSFALKENKNTGY